MLIIQLFKELYAYCTDFIIILANITGLSYYEVNFFIFILLYPFLMVLTPVIYFIQKRRLTTIRNNNQTMMLKTEKELRFKNMKTLSKRFIYVSANIAWIFLAVILTNVTSESEMKQMERLEQEIRDNPSVNRDSDLHAVGMGAFLTFSLSILFFLPLNFFIFLTTRNTNLPTRLLLIAPFKMPVILWELFFAFCLGFTFLIFLIFAWFGHYFGGLIMLFFAYILLNIRAGQISRYNK